MILARRNEILVQDQSILVDHRQLLLDVANAKKLDLLIRHSSRLHRAKIDVPQLIALLGIGQFLYSDETFTGKSRGERTRTLPRICFLCV